MQHRADHRDRGRIAAALSQEDADQPRQYPEQGNRTRNQQDEEEHERGLAQVAGRLPAGREHDDNKHDDKHVRHKQTDSNDPRPVAWRSFRWLVVCFLH